MAPPRHVSVPDVPSRARAPRRLPDARRAAGPRAVDQADARESISAILRTFGAEVVTAGSVKEAIDALDSARPNVLLADIAMPEQDGYDLIRRIRLASEPKVRTLAAAALTAYSSTEDRRRVLTAGYHLHMSKPAEPAELAAAVSQLAKTSRAPAS